MKLNKQERKKCGLYEEELHKAGETGELEKETALDIAESLITMAKKRLKR